MVSFIFFKFGMEKFLERLHIVLNGKMFIFQIKLFDEITLLVFIIYSFIKFKIQVKSP